MLQRRGGGSWILMAGDHLKIVSKDTLSMLMFRHQQNKRKSRKGLNS